MTDYNQTHNTADSPAQFTRSTTRSTRPRLKLHGTVHKQLEYEYK